MVSVVSVFVVSVFVASVFVASVLSSLSLWHRFCGISLWYLPLWSLFPGPRLHYRLPTLCPAPTDPVGQSWPRGTDLSPRMCAAALAPPTPCPCRFTPARST